MDARAFTLALLPYYDPIIHENIFETPILTEFRNQR